MFRYSQSSYSSSILPVTSNLGSSSQLLKADYEETKKMLKVENDADKPGMLILKSLANGSLGFFCYAFGVDPVVSDKLLLSTWITGKTTI